MANPFAISPVNPLEALLAGQQGYDTADKRYKQGQIEDARKAIASGNMTPQQAFATFIGAGDLQGATLASHQMSQAQHAADTKVSQGYEGRRVTLAEEQANEPKYMQSKDENDNPIIVEVLKGGKGFRTVSPAEIQRGGGSSGVPMAPAPARPYQQSGVTPENSGSMVGRPGERIVADASNQPTFDQRFAGAPQQPQAVPPQQPTMAPQPVGTMPAVARPAPGTNQPEYRKKVAHDQAEVAAARPKDERAANESIASLSQLRDEAQAIKNDPYLKRVTGLYGAFKSVPGSGAADLEARITTLISKTGFLALQTMRDASKTGGALGSITEKEHVYLQNSITALSQAQSEGAYRKALDRLIKHADGLEQRVKTAFENTHGVPLSAPVAAPQQSGGSNADPWGIR